MGTYVVHVRAERMTVVYIVIYLEWFVCIKKHTFTKITEYGCCIRKKQKYVNMFQKSSIYSVLYYTNKMTAYPFTVHIFSYIYSKFLIHLISIHRASHLEKWTSKLTHKIRILTTLLIYECVHCFAAVPDKHTYSTFNQKFSENASLSILCTHSRLNTNIITWKCGKYIYMNINMYNNDIYAQTSGAF